MAYLLDANVFIQAKRLYYGMDFCPAFWDWLCKQNKTGKIFSIEKVADELAEGGDDLSNWAAERGTAFLLPPDQQMLTTLATVSQWVQSQNYRPAAVSAFLQDADYYLIAYALSHKHVVVTHEIASDGNGNKKAYQPIMDLGTGKDYLVRVIVHDTVDPAKVVTVYRTSKIEKYWRRP